MALFDFPARRGPVTIKGQIVREDGTPVSGAEIGPIWFWDNQKRGGFAGYVLVKPGADGRFSLPLFDAPLPQTVFAVDAEQQHGAFAVITEKEIGRELTVRLLPLVPTAYAVEVPGWQGAPPAIFPRIGPTGAPACVTLPNRLSGEVRLPPGTYDLSVASTDLLPRTATFRTDTDRAAPVRLTMEPGIIPRNYGRPALPLRLTDAVGVPRTFRLADLKGKWVLLEFWGHWCQPCVTKSLPELRDFYLANPELRDRFEIMAFHSSDVGTAAALRPYLARLEKDVWGGKPLPFPVLLDGTGETVRRWGIAIYPQPVLLDPEGRYVRGASLELLARKIGVGVGPGAGRS